MPRAKKENITDADQPAEDVAVATDKKETTAARKVAVPRKSPKRAPRKLTFAQWAARRNVKPRHHAGLKAFLKNPTSLLSLEDWDKAFEKY